MLCAVRIESLLNLPTIGQIPGNILPMSWLHAIFQWLTGGPRHQYMTLVHCMDHDMFWIGVTVTLDLTVAAGYLVIARHWWVQERSISPSPERQALSRMKSIFLFCGLCGYIFIPIKMYWPAWRLYDAFMMVLVVQTWRYAWDARGLKVVYHQLGLARTLAVELEASKAEALRQTQFLNAVSHDLRMPLNRLVLQAELLDVAAKTDDRELLEETIRSIRESARATSSLLGRFVELADLDWSEQPRATDTFEIAELLDELVSRHRDAAGARSVELAWASEVGPLRTDREKLRSILEELLKNAVQFTYNGRIRVEARADGRALNISVHDTGQGISEKDLERIFHDFFQVANPERDPSRGLGLGLSLARRLAECLGGRIHVESTLGSGSTFRVHLPNALAVRGGEGPAVDRRAGRDPAEGLAHLAG